MKINKQKGNTTSILLIIAVLVIIGLLIYIQKIKSTDGRVIDEEATAFENKNTNITTGTTSKDVSLKNVDVQSSLVEKATGFVRKVYTKNGRNYIDIDYIVLENCIRNQDCPSGNKLINDNTLIRTFELSSNIRIKLQGGKNISYSEFLGIMQNKNDYRSSNPWDIIINTESVIMEISENYRS